jgi:Holliday junction resolvase-like predicted endonuclease
MMAKREPATGETARLVRAAPPDPERRLAFRFGLTAESRAAAYLIAKGYRILARRFKTPVGEIDIVARRRGVLVFVEVKARERLADSGVERSSGSPGTRTMRRATCASTSCWSHRAACRCILRARSTPRCD